MPVKKSDGIVPDRVIAIACLPRSGSGLVASALQATGEVGRCTEMLNSWIFFNIARMKGDRLLASRLVVSKWVRRLLAGRLRGTHAVGAESARRYLDAYPGYVMGPNRVLAVKQFSEQFRVHMLDHGFDMNYWGVPVVWVRLVRKDRLAQAVSYVRALQTRRWNSRMSDVDAPLVDDASISARLRVMADEEAIWDQYFATTGQSCLLVDYSELDTAYEVTMRRILDHVGLAHASVPAPQLERQRDSMNDEWIGRYRAAHPDVD